MRVLYLTLNPNRASTDSANGGLVAPASTTRPRAGPGVQPERGLPGVGAQPGHPNVRRAPAAPESAPPVRVRRRAGVAHPDRQEASRATRSQQRARRVPISQYAARVLSLPRVASVHFTMDRPFCTWAFGGGRAPDRLFFVSRSSQETCRPALTGIVPERSWHVLRNGLDLGAFCPDQTRRAEGRQRLGTGSGALIGVACALRPRKQLEHLFRAAARLDASVHVVVAGGRSRATRIYAERLLAEGRRLLGERLHLLGHLDELRTFYNALDVFVNTSQEEACSISVIEALACGCPVVGYASRSVDERILPRAGEIVPQDDAGPC